MPSGVGEGVVCGPEVEAGAAGEAVKIVGPPVGGVSGEAGVGGEDVEGGGDVGVPGLGVARGGCVDGGGGGELAEVLFGLADDGDGER